MATRPLLFALALAACGGPAHPAIAPDQPMGWIGLAPLTQKAPGNWLPVGSAAVIVPMPATGLPAGTAIAASDTAGHLAHLIAGAPSKLAYGCDQHQLDVVAFDGDHLAPGPVWLLPNADWHPHPVAIAAGAASETSRRATIGPFTIDLQRIDATHGTLAITRAGVTLYTTPIVREAMDGAPTEPLDFRTDGIAIPVPLAAWSLSSGAGTGAPILVIFRVASYEGTHLTSILVEAEHTRELPAMATYLYSCAF